MLGQKPRGAHKKTPTPRTYNYKSTLTLEPRRILMYSEVQYSVTPDQVDAGLVFVPDLFDDGLCE